MTEKTILLVEDNRDDEELAILALRQAAGPPDVVVARDGAEALGALFGESRPPAGQALPRLVLLDLNLPKIAGAEVLRRIRAHERTRLLPVVVLTSSAEERDLRETYSLGANSYVRKPVDFERFLDITGQLSRYWLEVNEPPPAQPIG